MAAAAASTAAQTEPVEAERIPIRYEYTAGRAAARAGGGDGGGMNLGAEIRDLGKSEFKTPLRHFFAITSAAARASTYATTRTATTRTRFFPTPLPLIPQNAARATAEGTAAAQSP